MIGAKVWSTSSTKPFRIVTFRARVKPMAPIVTNKHNAPPSLVEFAKQPHYDSEGSDFTVTQLIDSPRVRILRAEHADEIEDDVYENIFRLVGTAVHHIAEQNAGGSAVVERRVHLDVDGVDVSGAMDVLYQNEDGTFTIGDYKFTSTHSLRFPDKWEQQLNLLAYLLEKSDPDHAVVGRLEVYAILRDWSWRTTQRDSAYPSTPGVTAEVELWSKEKRESYFKNRLAIHLLADSMYAELNGIMKCTKEEMWEKDPTFAIKKKGRARAMRVLDSMEEATEYLHDKQLRSEYRDGALDDELFIEEREGERTRCEHFCEVKEFCNQWKEYNGNRS